MQRSEGESAAGNIQVSLSHAAPVGSSMFAHPLWQLGTFSWFLPHPPWVESDYYMITFIILTADKALGV